MGAPSMATLKAPTPFVGFDDQGRAVLAGTSYRVIQIASEHLAHGWSPEEISFQHYGELSLAQIYAALSYYHECQAEFDAEMERQLRDAEARRRQAGESSFVRRIRAESKLP